MRRSTVKCDFGMTPQPRQAGSTTTIANSALCDPRLSYRARGILAACLTHTKEFQLTRQWIDAHGTEGRDAITKAIHELRELGYVHDEWVVKGETRTRRMAWSDQPFTEPEVERNE